MEPMSPRMITPGAISSPVVSLVAAGACCTAGVAADVEVASLWPAAVVLGAAGAAAVSEKVKV